MTAKEFYLDTPLYTKVPISSLNELEQIISKSHFKKFDAFNPITKKDTTMSMIDGGAVLFDLKTNRDGQVKLQCVRGGNVFSFNFQYNGTMQELVKVGQYPSLADFHVSQIKQYDKVLPKKYQKEFTKAIGLAANGVGIGSFVYLRRIFESLVFEAAEIKEQDGGFDKERFYKMRMNEKIGYLNTLLPEFLVAHKELYSILSLGIHELDEEVCLLHFDSVKVGIELILDEKLEKFEKKQKIDAASAKIKLVTQTINNKI